MLFYINHCNHIVLQIGQKMYIKIGMTFLLAESFKIISQLESTQSYRFNQELKENQIYNWIIQYLEMLSTNQDALTFYAQIISNPQLLANGYNLIKQFLFHSQQNRSQTVINLMNSQVPVLSLVINIYPSEVFTSPQVSELQKQQTRQFLVNLLASQFIKNQGSFNKKLVNLLFSFVQKIHNIEGFQNWVVSYQQALQRLVQNQSPRFGQFILNILKEADDRVNQFSRHIIGLVVASDWIPNPQEQLEIIYYAFKSMAILNDTDPQTIQKYVSMSIQPTVTYTISNMTKSVRAMKFSLKILTILFADYQIECSKQLLQGIELTTHSLITQYINYLNRGSSSDVNSDMQFQQEEDDSDPIEVALYQMLQLFLTLYGNQVKIHQQLAVYLCIVSTFLSQPTYKRYIAFSDQFLMEVEDEGETNIRNKAIYFLQQMLENQKGNKKCKKMLIQYVNDIIGSLGSTNSKVAQFLSSFKMSQSLLNIPQIYFESSLFILYSFTDELVQNQKQISMVLGNNIQNSPKNSIDAILSIMILNKLVKKQPESYKRQYLLFLRQMTQKYQQNIGMLIALMRGLYSFSSQNQLQITEDYSNIPLTFLSSLFSYLYKNDSAQLESGYLILEFLLHLLKRPTNKPLLTHLIKSQNELYLLKTYINDGVTSSLMIDLIASLGNQATISVIYNQVHNGYANDQNLPGLLGKCLSNQTLQIQEQQLFELCCVYRKKLDLISEIIAAFMEKNTLQNPALLQILNENLSTNWMHYLLKSDQLQNLRGLYLSTVNKIAFEITSLSDLEHQLVIPFSLLLKNCSEAVNLLQTQGVFLPFFNKVFDYSKLFKGSHLRIITVSILAQLASLKPQFTSKVFQLYSSYGKIESSQWQDQEDEEGQKAYDRLFTSVINENVQKIFKKTFGQICWDNNLLEMRMAKLRS